MPDDTRRDLAALERDRLEADRRYNDALTAVDRAIVRAPSASQPVGPTPGGAPGLPAGWRGRLLRAVRDWIAPALAEQQAFNEQVAARLNESAARTHATAAALERFQTALIVFLQQITPLVDTKIRVADAATAARLAERERALAAIPELRAQVETLQRIVQSLKRRTSNAEAAETGDRLSAFSALKSSASTIDADVAYVGFEDRFRGTAEEIRERQAVYLPVFAGAAEVLDIGCGRGEFLDLLKAKGVAARGIDVNEEMVASARDRGLDATVADALGYLERLDDESLDGVMCAQVIEHLEPAYLVRLLEALSHKLRARAPIVIETINPACWLAFFSSYIRDITHVRPIHPETLEYLLQASGFGRVSIRFSAPVPDQTKMAPIHLPAEIVTASDPAARALTEAARVVNANAVILNGLLFTCMDYAAIGTRA